MSDDTPPTSPSPRAASLPPSEGDAGEDVFEDALPDIGLLPAIGEDLACLGGSLAALAGEPRPAGVDAGADYELHDEYDQLDLGELLLLQTDLKQEVERVLARLLTPRRVLLRDKVTFVLGTLSLVVGAFFLGHSPQTFYRVYTVEGICMLALRFFHYRWSRQHYYLLDWCYLANAMLMLHIWVYPTNQLLAKVTFAHAFGPLLWSVLAFRNSIVFHSLDKMTSHFMHLYPACVCWTLRWHTAGPLADSLKEDPAAAASWAAGGFKALVLFPVAPYLLWSVLYYLKIFVISSRKIEAKNYETLFKYSTQSRGSLFGAVVLRAPQRLQPLVYMLLHLALTLGTLLLNQLWWASYAANTAFLAFIFAASSWSGATYYFDYFAHRYAASVGLARRRTGSAAATPRSAAATPAVSEALSGGGAGSGAGSGKKQR
ncbi:membrane transporter [Micractinium conductrix]|uniref:Glycerophosphocholine acyltransferase 1 n=1 Tax=Micractinium conductrix TaxID=554055 RepID=A0A2P6VHX1_9CHLO|nr:membrane transporter [Micractinium conductrix]|eukprot:PSC73684.1 membrane transporter [Micractinium conductrix]